MWVSAMTLSQGERTWTRVRSAMMCSVMASCCDPRGCDRFFGKRFARRVARRYRKRGLGKTERAMVAYLESFGPRRRDGARGRRWRRRAARRAAQARRRARGQPRAVAGLRRGGCACCSPTWRSRAGSSGGCTTSRSSPTPSSRSTSSSSTAWSAATRTTSGCWARRPPTRAARSCSATRAATRSRARSSPSQNAGFRLARQEFRVFTHPPEAMVGVLREHGLAPRFCGRGDGVADCRAHAGRQRRLGREARVGAARRPSGTLCGGYRPKKRPLTEAGRFDPL